MSYIAPNTKVILCKGVPLDSGYNHTFWFASAQEQYTKLSSYAKFTDWQDVNYTYQRANRGSIRVKHKADDLYDVNYIMFQNTSYGNKWFYAFVTSVDYENDITTTVNYQLDVMQTWYFDYRLGNCFIEREHSATDAIGDNIVDEGIGIPDYVSLGTADYVCKKDTVHKRPAMALCIYYVAKSEAGSTGRIYKCVAWEVGLTETPRFNDPITVEVSWENAGRAQLYDGVVSPVNIFVIPLYLEDTEADGTTYTLQKTKEWIRKAFWQLETSGAEIVACVQMPYVFCSDYVLSGAFNKIFPSETSVLDETITLTQPTGFVDYPTDTPYTPKNNKLFTFPFQAITVSNNSGEDTTWRWEDFYVKALNTEDGKMHPKPQLRMVASPFLQPHLSCIPQTYKGLAEYFEAALNFEAYPQPAFSTDSFHVWFQQNKTSVALGAVSAAVSILANHYVPAKTASSVVQQAAKKQSTILGYDYAEKKTTSPAHFSKEPSNQYRAANNFNTVAGLVSNVATAQHTPNTASGNVLTDALLVKLGKVGFTFYKTACKKEYAEMVDSYFTMFGYAQNKNRVPKVSNIHKTRTNWNYIKCSTAVIHSVLDEHGAVIKSLPAEAEDEIGAIYENGITFWDKSLEPGEYGDGTNPISVV